MRSIVSLFVYILSIFFLLSCEGKNSTPDVHVALVSDFTNIEDKSYNQMAWRGVIGYVKEYNLPEKNYVSMDVSKNDDAMSYYSYLIDENFDLIITPGYYFLDSVDMVARSYVDTKFLLFDNGLSDVENVKSVTFANNEGSYLVGICAALKSKELMVDKIGFVGGLDISVVREFEAGFIAGVKSIDPKMDVMVIYTQDFSSPLKGQKIASKMYDDGIKVIFNVAGYTGTGIISEAKRRAKNHEDVWVVGVDKDQYEDGVYEQNKSVVLTSMLKRLDIATYDTIASIVDDDFEGGHITYSLKNNGVGLPEINPNLKSKWIKVVNKHKRNIIIGDVVVPKIPKRIIEN